MSDSSPLSGRSGRYLERFSKILMFLHTLNFANISQYECKGKDSDSKKKKKKGKDKDSDNEEEDQPAEENAEYVFNKKIYF